MQPYVSSLSSASTEQNSQNLEVKPSDRRELPVVNTLHCDFLLQYYMIQYVESEWVQDLFSMNYAMIPGSVQGWQEQHPYGMGLSMQYPIVTIF